MHSLNTLFFLEQKSLQAGREYTNIKYSSEVGDKFTLNGGVSSGTLLATTSPTPPPVSPRNDDGSVPSQSASTPRPPIPPRTANQCRTGSEPDAYENIQMNSSARSLTRCFTRN